MTLKQFLNVNDQFAAQAGCQIEEISEGYAKATMTVEPRHLNAAGVCQGGALFTLADLATAAVMNSHGDLTLSLQNNIAFLRSAKEGDHLTAEARESFNHHRIPYINVEIKDGEGNIICIISGIAFRKKGVPVIP